MTQCTSFLFLTAFLLLGQRSSGQRNRINELRKVNINFDSTVTITKVQLDSIIFKSTTLLKTKKLSEISDQDHIDIARLYNTALVSISSDSFSLTQFSELLSDKEYMQNITNVYPDWIPSRGMGFYFPKVQIELGGTPHAISYFTVVPTQSGQTIKTSPTYLFIDKPSLHLDSSLIIRKVIKKIIVYRLTIRDSSSYDKKIFGTWTLQIDSTKIISSKWDGISELYFPVSERRDKKNKITETRGEYRLTHILNNGKIIKTENKTLTGIRMEDGFFFDNILYKYDKDGFLIEASYNIDGLLDPDVPYMEYKFEYSR